MYGLHVPVVFGFRDPFLRGDRSVSRQTFLFMFHFSADRETVVLAAIGSRRQYLVMSCFVKSGPYLPEVM